MSTGKKPRIKIQRPKDAAPNTAFTQLSQESSSGCWKIRVAMDPSDLADDSEYSDSSYEVRGPVIYDDHYNCGFEISCRSPDALRRQWYVAQIAMRDRGQPCHDAECFLTFKAVKR